jgi:hypothetical protein
VISLSTSAANHDMFVPHTIAADVRCDVRTLDGGLPEEVSDERVFGSSELLGDAECHNKLISKRGEMTALQLRICISLVVPQQLTDRVDDERETSASVYEPLTSHL